MIALVWAALSLQQDYTVLRAEDEPRRALYKHLQAECQRHFDARRKAVAALKTPEDLKKRQDELKARFISALGGLPERTPLNARTAGTARRDGYSVERVIYESRPDHHVTATLYLPEGKGPFPGVLFPCGHFNNAKAAETYQRSCILLARHGIAALCFDPISQGERVQLLAPDGKPAAGYGTGEHTHLGVAALLVGQCAASYLVWDCIRSLDYLASRPEVDPKRLGCLGNSGGGTQTAYLMALDERVAAAVPNCYITSLERLFATIGPQDAEQNIPGQVVFGMEHADYVTMRAPRPTLISCTTRDFFDIDGVWQTYREAKVVYGAIGYGERVDLSEFNDKHAISRPVRESALRWFRRWLLDKDDAATEAEFPVAQDEELWCTKSGQVVRDLRGRTAFDFVAERERALAPGRGRLAPRDLVKEVRRLLAVDAPAAFKVREGRSEEKVVVESEPGFPVPVVSFKPPGPNRCVIYLHEDGKAAGRAEIERLVAGGAHVLAPDLRGWGETAPSGGRPQKTGPFSGEWKEAFLALHLNRPLLGQRVRDLLAVVKGLASKDEVELVATGAAGPVALHAAALEPAISSVTVEGSLVSWSDVIRKPVGAGQLPNVVPGALAVYDLPDLAAAIAPRKLTVRRPVDPAGKPVTQADLEGAYAGARSAYERAGVPDRLALDAR